MDERTRDRSVPKKPRPNRLVRFLAFLVTVALVLGAVVLVVNYDKLNFDSIKRWFTYWNLSRNDSGQADSFRFDGDISNAFAVLDGELLVCSPNNIRLYSGDGQVSVDKTVSMTNPTVSVVGKNALIYDIGGQDLFVYSGQEESFSLSQSAGSSLLCASLNSSGWLIVVSQESGSKGTITVYDSTYSPQIQLRLSTRFVMDAVLSPDNKSMALLTMGLTDGTFESRVELYRLERTEEEIDPDWTCPVGSDAILDLRWDNSGIWALGETGTYLVDPDGTLSSSYSYGGRYLKSFSLDGDGTVSLLLGKYRAGSASELVIVSSDGTERATLAIDEQVLSLSSAGRYTSLLTADRLDIYDQDLDLYTSLEGTKSALKVLQYSDGSAMLIGNNTAHLYVPQ
ncbi:DUF5711 family protein [Flavonifractor hominis]|uniref:DUF5711 family protein n=1 Tax=Flavonifractor hominis TaxID=3133178 RepID=A0ABV1EM78_9FIRM